MPFFRVGAQGEEHTVLFLGLCYVVSKGRHEATTHNYDSVGERARHISSETVFHNVSSGTCGALLGYM